MRKAGISLILPMFSSLLAMRRFIVVFVQQSMLSDEPALSWHAATHSRASVGLPREKSV